MLNIQNYVRAESLEQAYELNQNRRSHVLGGMLWLRQSDITVGTAIDLKNTASGPWCPCANWNITRALRP